MFIWSFDEPVEIAALQFANVFFSVPQVSLRISKMPEDQKKMLAFYLKMRTEIKELILDGQFTPMNPEANYPPLMT
jgi:alpha-galactosidase